MAFKVLTGEDGSDIGACAWVPSCVCSSVTVSCGPAAGKKKLLSIKSNANFFRERLKVRVRTCPSLRLCAICVLAGHGLGGAGRQRLARYPHHVVQPDQDRRLLSGVHGSWGPLPCRMLTPYRFVYTHCVFYSLLWSSWAFRPLRSFFPAPGSASLPATSVKNWRRLW